MNEEYVGAFFTALLVLFVVWILFLGKYHPRSGADVLQWRPTRSPEVEAQNEVDDIDEMLDAANERRRARGKPERTKEQVTADMARYEREHERRRERDLVDEEVRELLAAKNERRARKGLPALTLEEFKASRGIRT